MLNNYGTELVNLTSQERNALTIALGVLRSNTDYGDFLNCWLQDYGLQVLSPHPPPPLVPDTPDEEFDCSVKDALSYVN